MFYWCEFGKGGARATRNELDVEVELNVKLLKEKYDWILERANFRRTLSDPIKLAEILELAKSIDASIPKDFSSDGAGSPQHTSAEQSGAGDSSHGDDA